MLSIILLSFAVLYSLSGKYTLSELPKNGLKLFTLLILSKSSLIYARDYDF